MAFFSQEMLGVYYDRLFPYSQLVDWISYGKLLPYREFSFTVGDDVYIRYLSYNTVEDFKKDVKRKLPNKIDIGAMYNIPPSRHASVRAGSFIPKTREFVLDIDLTDYEELFGKDGNGFMWSNNKWTYMSIAIKSITHVLKETFGFEHLLWVFSGRRGVHCWVCDESAREMSDQQRSSLMKFLNIFNGNKIDTKFPLHPSLEEILPIITSGFEKIYLKEDSQCILENPEDIEKVLKHIPDSEVCERLRRAWEENMQVDESEESISEIRWNQLKATVLDAAEKMKKKDPRQSKELEESIEKIILFFAYPRLDVNVSTHKNHLLKSPFVAHPSTGKICVPIFDVENCDLFDPDQVPTLSSLFEELNNYSSSQDESEMKKRKIEDWMKTSMSSYINRFEEEFLKKLKMDEAEEHIAVTKGVDSKISANSMPREEQLAW